MIEQHYGHLHPAQQADVIAGERMGARAKTVAKSAQPPDAKTKPKLKVVK